MRRPCWVDAAKALGAAGSPSPRLDAELLVSHAFGRDRTWLHAHPEARLEGADEARLRGWVERRAAGEPIAYIRGFKEWLSLRIATDRRALIPRPETELLAEAAIDEIAARLVRDDEPIAVWEVGTGSGAVAVALGVAVPDRAGPGPSAAGCHRRLAGGAGAGIREPGRPWGGRVRQPGPGRPAGRQRASGAAAA